MRGDSIPIVREGYPFIGLVAFLTFILAILHLQVPALLGLATTFFVTYFFRNPDRIVPTDPDAVVAPADGKVIAIETNKPALPFFSQEEFTRISIFMSIFDVHVNRAPCAGCIEDMKYFRGKFIAAQKEKSSEKNERNCILLKTKSGSPVVVVQIAGLIARRIVCWKKVGEGVNAGERIGMIRFGSRVDVFVPATWRLEVRVGARVRAGEDVICRQM
ncbi:MAG: phosphatidylserine decarboxylase family protein [Thermoplasmata archaeon]|nr:MAG: phosphatidylserine decarboxylase family protein [Thermoplasmata archaeon]